MDFKPQKVLRPLAAMAIVAFGVLILSLVIGETHNAGNKDFTSYWAAGQLLIRHANPYDPEAVLRIEQSAGFSLPKPLLMRNPPFALILALPLGLVSAKLGAVLWSLLLVAAIMLSVRLTWALNCRPPDRLHLLGYIFAPVLSCLALGQTSVFALVGLVLFLKLREMRPFAAGAALALLAIKPHVILPFALVVLLWSFRRRMYFVPLGAIAAMACALAPALWLDHSLLSHYVPVFKDANAESAWIPTFSSLVHAPLRRFGAWSQFLPLIVGVLWAVFFFRRNRDQWDWNRQGLLLLLVSVWIAPYCWFTDEIILLPAILRGIFLASNRSLISFAVIDGIALLAAVFGVPVGSGFFIWTSTAWIAWYVFTVRQMDSKASGI